MKNNIYYNKCREDINNYISLILICVNKVKRRQIYVSNNQNKSKIMKRHMKEISKRFKL